MQFITKDQFRIFIKEFNFSELFNQLGWNYLNEQHPIKINEQTFVLLSVAEKSGFRILICDSDSEGKIPDYTTRQKIDRKITHLFAMHLIIFCDKNKTEQLWQYVLREPGKPAKLSEVRWNKKQDPELLFQKTSSLFFTLDEEEERITIIDVTDRVNQNFHQNNEKVTKKFYEGFKVEHKAFLGFIKGIGERVNAEWYASLMLNRLMFCYFIQKKGFLNKNRNYLGDKLKECQALKGKEKFYSFYRNFLLELFHEGLAKPEPRTNLKVEIGTIPYLNGGLFDLHPIEESHPNIDINDAAFDRIFDFFDKYNWHLDTRNEASGKDINPDVIGHIFEKYINERSKMGAYYTKEDVTEYISKTCIIPYLFDEVKRNYPVAFAPENEIWNRVKESGDLYIYSSLKKGLELELPKEIENGIKNISHRTNWNDQAFSDFALPNEIWREVVERRSKYFYIKGKLENGEIKCINDFITYNLDIRQFFQDILINTNDPELIEYFYKALCDVTIIDPTCGSGAFLFAAMNILEPLYDACITRMRAFVEDEDRLNHENKKSFIHKYKFFREVLETIQSPQHNNKEYFIYKTIILRNLYGVDIMREATEIAKLRLFLKLVATVEADYSKPNLGIEPLPDIDFNIRSGNTLIGFTTKKELDEALYTFDGMDHKPQIEDKLDKAALASERFKDIQLTHGEDFVEFKNSKDELNKILEDLNWELNQLLHKQVSGIKFNKWLTSYQPFHWIAMFYRIMYDKKGFDVVIGNPPYVEYSEKKFAYRINEAGFSTYPSRNLYSLIFERAKTILSDFSRIGMIVQISSVSTPAMTTMAREIKNSSVNNWISNYATRPAYLFDGVTMNLTIIISEIKRKDFNFKDQNIYSTRYMRWKPEYRKHLFEYVSFCKVDPLNYIFDYSIPKLGTETDNVLLEKIRTQKKNLNYYLAASKHRTNQEIFYRTAGGRYFKIFMDQGFGSESTSNKSKYFLNEYDVYVMIAVLSSGIWWWYYTLHFDMYNCKDYMMFSFPFDYNSCANTKELSELGKELCNSLMSNAEKKIQSYETTGSREQLIFRPSISKPIINKIDRILSKHYNLTEEQTEYIIEYDIKYRLSKEEEEK